MTDTTTTVTLAKIAAAMSFGPARDDGYETDGGCPADGGWVNTKIQILVGGREIGTALIGAWVHTDAERASSGISQAIYDATRRSGFAIRRYEGNDRGFEAADGRSWQEIFDLTDDDAEELADWEIEQAVLDAATEHDETDYEDIFADALRARLEGTGRARTYDLMRAVRGLYRAD